MGPTTKKVLPVSVDRLTSYFPILEADCVTYTEAEVLQSSCLLVCIGGFSTT